MHEADAAHPLTQLVTSVGTEESALMIAEELVGQELAACVNIVPCLRSMYRWKTGQICEDTEYLLIVKTPAAFVELVEKTIMELHTYELPEVMAIPVERTEPITHQWVVNGVHAPLTTAAPEDDRGT